jgi:hypothetical protein
VYYVGFFFFKFFTFTIFSYGLLFFFFFFFFWGIVAVLKVQSKKTIAGCRMYRVNWMSLQKFIFISSNSLGKICYSDYVSILNGRFWSSFGWAGGNFKYTSLILLPYHLVHMAVFNGL